MSVTGRWLTHRHTPPTSQHIWGERNHRHIEAKAQAEEAINRDEDITGSAGNSKDQTHRRASVLTKQTRNIENTKEATQSKTKSLLLAGNARFIHLVSRLL